MSFVCLLMHLFESFLLTDHRQTMWFALVFCAMFEKVFICYFIYRKGVGNLCKACYPVHTLSLSISSKQAACFTEKYLNYALWTKSKLYFPETHIFCLNSVDLKVSWVHMICCSMGSTATWGRTYNSYCVTETPLLVNKNCGKHFHRIINRLPGSFFLDFCYGFLSPKSSFT